MKTLWTRAICLALITTAYSIILAGNTTAADLEQQIREVMKSGSEYIVVIDNDKTFLAIPISGIKDVVKNRIFLEGGTTVAMKTPQGFYDEQEMATKLIEDLEKSGSDSFSFTMDKDGNLVDVGTTKTVKDNARIKVKKIITLSE